MKSLLIDNGTKHIEHLMMHFPGIKVCSWENIVFDEVDRSDLIILSGSYQHAVSKKDIYKDQVEILKRGRKPVLGICAGFELIVSAFGGTVIRRDEKIYGEKLIKKLTDDEIFREIEDLTVFEAHRWVASGLSDELLPLAMSDTGYEIVKHKKFPIYGFQFHPEVPTKSEAGMRFLSNFKRIFYNYSTAL